MEDKKDYGDLFSKEVKEEPKSEKKFQHKPPMQPSKKGKVANITPDWITVEMSDGTGQRVLFDAKKHSSLKKGDPIEV